ncbi:uracil-DNA glycosylase [Patescibacteria group bacterium]|nr:uracil-DNA glycosylase [Patescibacteria group bacterium]
MPTKVDKQKALDKIAKEIDGCKICQKDSIGKGVPGEGNPNAKIVFVGEAPGKLESQTGRPFVGRSGKFLRSTLKEAGISEKDVYITSPVKYLPKRGTPSKDQIEHGKIHFDKQIDLINPSIIVLLGKVAIYAVLGEDAPVLKRHGEIIEKNGKKYLITIHPAAVVRFKKYREIFVEDLNKIANI